MELNEIIEEIKKNGYTAYKIAEKTSLTEVGINKILNGNSKNPRKETLKILENFLHNKFETIAKHPESITKQQEEIKGVPYFDVEFTAGFLEVENNQSMVPDSYISHPFFKGCDYVVRASGQSMAKIISHGDAIGLVKINNWRDFFPFGEIYAIVTNDGFRMVKIITKGETEDTYTLISKPTDSKKDEFPPQQIKKNSILSILKVQAASHLF